MKIKKLFIDKINQLLVDLNNHYLDHRDKQWASKRHHVKCIICGDEIYSQYLYGKEVSQYSPEQCGWLHIKSTDGLYKGKGWICHSCNGHFHEHWINRDKFKDCIEFTSEVTDEVVIRDCDNNVIKKFPSKIDRHVTIDSKKLLKAFGIECSEDVKYELKEN